MSTLNLDALAAQLDSEPISDAEPERHLLNYSRILHDIRWHGESRFCQFIPSYMSPFENRLREWLANTGLSQSMQATMLRTVLEIQFVDRDDLMSLYRAAYDGPIRRWLIDVLQVDVDSPEAEQRIRAALTTTWFCPITDSMDIAQFHHFNQIPGADQRPAWRVLAEFGDATKILAYMRENSYERIVLLEDFVGSGTQAASSIEFALAILPSTVPLLVMPLVMCETARLRIKPLVEAHPGNMQLRTVLVIPEGALLGEHPAPDERPFMRELRDLTASTFPAVQEPAMPGGRRLTNPRGFRGVGALVVLHTNCPNNTLPLVWRSTPLWTPLFPRVSRA